jgi:hypothetical protein
MATDREPEIAELYLRRPTAEYSRAFDRACAALEDAGGQALAVASSATHAVEFLRRCRRPLAFAGTGALNGASFVERAGAWAWGPIQAAGLDSDAAFYDALAWAEPERASAAQVSQTLRRLARPGATLHVVASSRLRCYLPAWQRGPLPADEPLAPGEVLAALRRAGWWVAGSVCYHGPRAIAWGRLQQLAEALGRPDWADRCRLHMWAAYEEAGWNWRWAPMALIHALPA